MSVVQDSANRAAYNAKQWADMLVAPQDVLCRAPSSTPFLASHTRFVRAVDIPYNQTGDGHFTVAMTPSTNQALLVTGVPGPIPVAGPSLISLTALENLDLAPSGMLGSGTFIIRDGASGKTLGTTPVQDCSPIHPNYTNILGLIFTPSNATNLELTISGRTQATDALYAKYVLLRTNGLMQPSDVVSLKTPFSVTQSMDSEVRGLTVWVCSASGNLIDPEVLREVGLSVFVRTNGFVPNAGNAQSFSLAPSELIEAGRVGMRRCTAMSLLVTNMASPLESGGELVVARAPASIINNSGAAAIMQAIKQLPEEKYWRSGAILDGGYAWWLPDDLNSYEPHNRSNLQLSENLLYAAGVMASNEGFVRVIATWAYEFYTPVQLFSRDYNLCFSEYHRVIWQELTQKSAVSANMGHLALIAAIATTAGQIYDFYQRNKSTIDPMARNVVRIAKASASALRPQPKKPAKTQQKKKAAQPPPPQRKSQPKRLALTYA